MPAAALLATVAVLYSAATPRLRTALPPAACRYHAIEGFKPSSARAETVVVAGHALPPTYLGRPAGEVAAAIAAFRPQLVVMDTCYGASTPILDALAARGVRALVVGTAYAIPESGLVYGPAFLGTGAPAARAQAVATDPPFPLLRWAIAPQSLAEVHAALAPLDGRALRRKRRTAAGLVAMPLGGAGEVLVPVPAARFR